MGQDCSCFAAEEQPFQTFAAMRGHDDQIAIQLLGHPDDFFGWRVSTRQHGVAIDAIAIGNMLDE